MPKARGQLAPPPSLPASAIHPVRAWTCLGAMLGTLSVLNFWPPFHHVAYLGLIAGAALGAFLPDLQWQKVQRRVRLAAARPANWSRTLTKCLGLLATVAAVGAMHDS
jgi:hypothetical protein